MEYSVREHVEVFATCPPSSTSDRSNYLKRVADIARWSEQAGCRGILIYSDNTQVNPWLVAQVIIENTSRLCPLIAVQPAYMHPYTLANKVASMAYLYGRRVYLNMVAGGFKNDLLAMNDQTPDDQRYQRLIEYTRIVKELLENPEAISFDGEFYTINNLRLSPSMPPELLPGIFISGSSDAGLAAAREIGATAIHYPKPVADYQGATLEIGRDSGIRIGVVCREASADAWDEAYKRFPEDNKEPLVRHVAIKESTTDWPGQLPTLVRNGQGNPYWLEPFNNHKTMCPYLVGDYWQVGEELEQYISLGYQTFILDVPGCPDDLFHTRRAFERAGTYL